MKKDKQMKKKPMMLKKMGDMLHGLILGISKRRNEMVIFLLVGIVLAGVTLWLNTKNTEWVFLTNLNTLIGFITVFISYRTWSVARLLKRENVVTRKEVLNDDGVDYAILEISCGMDTNKAAIDVKKFLTNNSTDKTYESVMQKELPYAKELENYAKATKKENDGISNHEIMIEKRCIFLSLCPFPGKGKDEDIYSFLKDYANMLESICRTLGAGGIRKVHLFIKGPIFLGYLAGERFKNNFIVYAYHYDSNEKDYYLANSEVFNSYVDENEVIRFE